MTTRTHPARPVLLLCAGLLAACSSTVVREPSRSPARPVSSPRYGATTVVQRGDTLYSLATRNGISVLDLAAWNTVPPPYTIYPGQRLRLYPQGPGPKASVATVSRPPVQAAPKPGGATTPKPTSATTAVTQRPVPTPPVTADSGFAWRWPADGALIGRFVTGDPTRQGVDIGGRAGDPVRAAANGTVVYSGSGLVGYGELIIIKHSDTWLSAYGHNRKRLVNEGEVVKAGEAIAEMGRTGAAREMLHFEIRYNGRPVDPLSYLPAR